MLRYKDDRPYDILDYGVNNAWKYQRGEDANAPSVVADLQAAIVQKRAGTR